MPTYSSFSNSTKNRQGFDIPVQHLPSNSHSNGISPAGKFIVAPYLPLLRYNSEKFTFTVISGGKPLAFDAKGSVVPAVLRLEAIAYATDLATSVATADTNALVRYTQLDVQEQTRNFKGVLVVAGEPVVKSFFTGTTLDNEVSYFTSVAFSDVWQHAGGDNLNPTTLTYTNFNRQPVISIVCDNHQQYPIVKDLATMRTAPLAGIAAMIGMPSDFGWGSFVTYDRESNFVPAAKHGYGSANPASIVGQITGITVFKDPTTNAKVGNHNYLDKVVGPNQATANVLNQLPSSHNDGMGTFLTYSNGYGMVEFGVQTR